MEINQTNSNSESGTNSLNWWTHLIAIIAVLIIVSVSLTVYLVGYGGWDKLTEMAFLSPESELATEVTFPVLGGGIFISAILEVKEDTNTSLVPTPLVALPGSQDLLYVPIDQLPNGEIITIQPNASSGSNKLTFLGRPLTEDPSYDTLAIYRADTSTEESTAEDFLQAIQNTATLVSEPDAEDYFRNRPVISPAGDILYSSLSEAKFDPEPATYGTLPAEEWVVYRIDADNQRQVITSGLSPKWIDEDRFVFLKNDGIYLHTLSTNEEVLVWYLDFTPSLINSFDVSDDAHLLAISNPEASIVTIIENQEWGNDTAALHSGVFMKATDVTFAPNNSYLAVLLPVASDETGRNGFAELSYYALEEQAHHTSTIKLDDPKLKGIYLTDWK